MAAGGWGPRQSSGTTGSESSTAGESESSEASVPAGSVPAQPSHSDHSATRIRSPSAQRSPDARRPLGQLPLAQPRDRLVESLVHQQQQQVARPRPRQRPLDRVQLVGALVELIVADPALAQQGPQPRRHPLHGHGQGTRDSGLAVPVIRPRTTSAGPSGSMRPCATPAA